MECKTCLMTDDIARIEPDGECEYCKLHKTLENNSSPAMLEQELEKLRRKGKNKFYDCLIGISGGFDSSLLLEYAVKKWNLRPLVIHFDNGWNDDFAEHNISVMTTMLNVDFIRYQVNREEYDDACKAFLYASTPDADIPNDIIMTATMYRVARMYGIKYILNGHCFRTEGSSPRKWTYMDSKYIRSVYKAYIGKEIKTLPLLSIKDQVVYGFLGIKNIRPFHHIKIDRSFELRRLKSEYGWTDYQLKHGENIYTAFIGYYLLPLKFGIDKRRVYLSARIRSGMISKAEAKHEISKGYSPISLTKIFERLGLTQNAFSRVMDYPVKDHTDFDCYNFKRYRFPIWILVRMKILPYTFYYKYCKNA